MGHTVFRKLTQQIDIKMLQPIAKPLSLGDRNYQITETEMRK